MRKVLREAGIRTGDEGTASGGEDNGWDGWDGGVVWLVPTDRPIDQWKAIATRELR